MSHYSAAVLSDHPMAYYRLNESNGSIATDLTGNSSSATLSGGVTFGQTGAIASESDPSILFGAFDTLSLPYTLNISTWTALTLEFWIKLTGLWQYVVITATTTTTTYYLNGELYTLGTAPDTILVDGTLAFAGSSTTGGDLDEVALYNYVLSPDQVASHFQSASSAINTTALLNCIDSVTRAIIDFNALVTSGGVTGGATSLVSGTSSSSSPSTLSRILTLTDLGPKLALLQPAYISVQNVSFFLSAFQSISGFYLQIFPFLDALDAYIAAYLTPGVSSGGLNAWLSSQGLQVQANFAAAFNAYCATAVQSGFRTTARVPVPLSTANYFPSAVVDPIYSFTCTSSTTLSSTVGSSTSTQGGGVAPLYIYKTSSGTGTGGASLTLVYLDGNGHQVTLNNYPLGSLVGSTTSVSSANASSLGISAQSVISLSGTGMSTGEAYSIGGRMTRSINSY